MPSKSSLTSTAIMIAIASSLSGCAFLQSFLGKGGGTLRIKPGTPALRFASPAFYVHTEPGSAGTWRLRGSGPAAESHRYSGRLVANDGGKIDTLEVSELAKKGGKVELAANGVEFDFTAPGGVSGTSAAGFSWANSKGKCHNFQLLIDGRPARGNEIVVGMDGDTHPSGGTFTVCRAE